jgi:predicted amidophosphoribosyltransferase
MHADKQKQRGFNQAELMARAFCDVTGLTLQPTGLSRIRATEPQFSLSPAEREQNLAGAIQVGESLHRCPHSKAVLLLDDIYTTGATARAAVHVLQQQQISVYGLVVLAKASGFDAKGGRQILL